MIERLGWTLLHFVWEGCAVALALAFGLLLARRASAAFRYGLACLALAALAAAPVATFLALAPARSLVVLGRAVWTPGETILAGGGATEDRRLLIVVGAWAVGVALLSLRLVGSLIHLDRERRHTRPTAPEWQDRAAALARRLGIGRAVALRVSDRIGVPSAWGVVRPLIVLPASLLAGLPPTQVEAILLHELAHIRRHDYLVNLVQSVVETVLFYHPVVWWVSAVVREEREHCCDDLVVATLGDPMPYARALLHLEERRLLPRPSLSAKEGHLMNRIARILAPKPAPARVSPSASILAALGVLSAVMGGALQAQAQAAKAEKPAPKPKAAPAAKKAPKPTKSVRPTIRLKAPTAPAKINVWTYPAAPTAVAPVTTAKAAVTSQAPLVGPVGKTTKPALTTAKPPVTAATAPVTSPAQGGLGGGAFGGFGGGQATGGFGGRGATGNGEHPAGFGGAMSGGFGMATLADDTTVEVSGGRVDIDMNADRFSAVMRKLAKQAKLSVVIEPGNYQILQLTLSGQSVEDAFEILCRAAGATFRREKGVYYVSPRAVEATAGRGGFPGGLGGGG